MKNIARPAKTKRRSRRAILSEYMMTLIELAQIKESIRTSSKLVRT